MAFDHPVEADRVDLSLTSIIARAPVIGSLMYLLGGRHAREEEEYHTSNELVDFALASSSDNNQSSSLSKTTTAQQQQQRPLKSALKSRSPSLAPTEDASDTDSFQSALDAAGENIFDVDQPPSLLLGRKKKELSWSDESGQNLVQYIDAHHRISAATKEGQMEHGFFDGGSSNGGMTRTRSVRHQLEENHPTTRDNKSYLPRMTPHGGGVVMPTMHNHHPHPPSSAAALNGGIDSPQWGWYTNLTPPSPQMYTAHAYPKRGVSSASVTSSSDGSNNNKPKRPSCTKPNPIFQSLPSQRKDRSTHPTMPL